VRSTTRCGPIPDDWLARYCRARLRAMIPGAYGVVANVADELAMAAEDLDQLIQRQSYEPWLGYFASAYLLDAFVGRLTADMHTSRVDPDRVSRRRSTATSPLSPRQ
jgi:hypothetical protein